MAAFKFVYSICGFAIGGICAWNARNGEMETLENQKKGVEYRRDRAEGDREIYKNQLSDTRLLVKEKNNEIEDLQSKLRTISLRLAETNGFNEKVRKARALELTRFIAEDIAISIRPGAPWKRVQKLEKEIAGDLEIKIADALDKVLALSPSEKSLKFTIKPGSYNDPSGIGAIYHYYFKNAWNQPRISDPRIVTVTTKSVKLEKESN